MSKKKSLKRLVVFVVGVAMAEMVHTAFKMSMPVIINRGVSFGIEAPLVIIFVLLGYLSYRVIIEGSEKGWWLMASGGWINMIDRLVSNGVADYWKVPVVGVYNNFGDWLIFGGMVSIIYGYIRWYKNNLRR